MDVVIHYCPSGSSFGVLSIHSRASALGSCAAASRSASSLPVDMPPCPFSNCGDSHVPVPDNRALEPRLDQGCALPREASEVLQNVIEAMGVRSKARSSYIERANSMITEVCQRGDFIFLCKPFDSYPVRQSNPSSDQMRFL